MILRWVTDLRHHSLLNPDANLRLGLGYIETYSNHPAGGIVDKELLVNAVTGATPATLDVNYTFN